MVKHGLGQVDLNQRACLALAGLTENPEADIVHLLRSGQPIEPITRQLLADAVDGKSSGVGIRIARKADMSGVRSFQIRIERLRLGRLAQLRDGRSNADQAALKGIGKKKLEACITLARGFDAWISRIRSSHSEFDHLSDSDLEMAYIYADAFRHDPDNMIKGSLPLLTRLIAYWQDLKAGKKGFEHDWMQP